MKNTLLLLTLLPLMSFGQMTEEEALAKIYKALEYPDTVTVLHLGNSGLTFLPSEIGQLYNLQVLTIDFSPLTSLPPEIGQLTNLQSLNLMNCRLTHLPKEIGQLTNLKRLILMHNQLISIPPEIGKLSKLEDLDFSSNDGFNRSWPEGGNNLTSLPTEMSQLLNLRFLGLYDAGSIPQNQVTELQRKLPNCEIEYW